ncbi:MAG: 3'(2'),5'-bisphosphate nucleotidase CysQ family protein [Candidatus Woesearchaeota archaeon]
MIDLERVLSDAKSAAYLAGREIMRLRDSFDTTYKGHEKEIVTTADTNANKIIHDTLLSKYSTMGWLSEETADNDKRLNQEYVWLVDPLDGTKHYAAGDDEFTVSIALVQNGLPIIGIVYQPSKNIMYSASKGMGAYENDNKINVSNTDTLENATLITSKRVKSKPEYIKLFGNICFSKEEDVGGTALRLAKIAVGEADFYLSTGNSEWGIAAGDMLVTEAGGKSTDVRGNSLIYNKPNGYVVPMIMSNNNLHKKIAGLIAH